MNLELQNKVVIVSGSSRGIGRAIAETFLREGARVAVTGRSFESLDETSKYFQQQFGADRVLSFCGDLTQTTQIANLLSDVQERWSGIDYVVPNIGSGSARAGWEQSAEDWKTTFEANLWSSIRFAEMAMPALIQSRGSITFIGSIVGVESLNAPLTYSVAKSALHSYSANLARLAAKEGVRVNCVAPGNILFPGGSWDQKLKERSEWCDKYIIDEVPAARFGTPQEIADLVVFLASPRAAFVTGAIMVADGGQTRSF